MKIYIIGSGWYGCHIALDLAQEGHSVTLLEKNEDIFQGTSGKFGIRLHAGPHYPRSKATRENCLRTGEAFKKYYPELVVPHQYAIYGLGEIDADRQPSKVSKEVFEEVCKEPPQSELVDPLTWGYQGLLSAANIEEPSIVLGQTLRERMRIRLRDQGVILRYNTSVKSLELQEDDQVLIHFEERESEHCDFVINASGYQSLMPDYVDFPLDIEVMYQPCLAMMYRDKRPEERPFSFIVMDGWFPCIMPYVTGEEGKDHQYILTHGKWTIMGSFKTPAGAQGILSTLSDEVIEKEIKPRCEEEINRFWPVFAERFEYIGWSGTVLAKPNTKSEFRSAITYAEKNIIHIIPGKVTNIFDAAQEVRCLLDNSNILTQGRYRFMRDGVFHRSAQEIRDKSSREDVRSTYALKTLEQLRSQPLLSESQHILWSKSKEPPKEDPCENLGPRKKL